MSFLRKALLINTTEFFCLVIAAFQSIVLTRVLGPEGIGQYAVINSAMMVILQIASFGFPLSFLYHSQRNPGNSSEYLINTIWAIALLGTVGGIVLSALVCFRTSYFGAVPRFMALALVVYVPIHLQGFVARAVLLIKIQSRKISLMRILSIAGSFVPIVVFSLLGILNVYLAILCVMLAALTMAVAGWSSARPSLDFSKRLSLKLCGKLGFMGIRLSWADIMIVVNGQISILIIKYLIDDFDSVGYFSRGLRIAALAVTAGQAVMPLLFSRWASISESLLSVHVEKVMRVASTFAVVMIGIILLTGKWIIVLFYGRDFLPAVQPMMILLPGAVLYLLSKTLIALLSSRGLPEVSAIFLIIGLVVNVVLSWYLIPFAGIAGAAWASTASNIALLCGLMFAVKRKFSVRVKQCLFVNSNDVNSIINTLLDRNT